MKIGFFTDTYIPTINGVSTSVEGLARSLEKRGHSVTIVAPKSPGYKDKRKNVVRLRSIKVVKDPEIRLASFVPEKTFVQVAQQDFDVIHGFAGGTITSLGLGLSKVKGIPFVGTYNTRLNRYTHYVFKGKIIRPKVIEQATRLFANRCDCLIVPSSSIKKELQSFGVKRPIVVLPNGVDTQTSYPKGFLRKRAGIPANKTILLYVGRLGKEKSVDFLVRSYALIRKQRPDTVLAIVGDGPEKKRLMSLSKKLKIAEDVYFTGYISTKDVTKVYSDATAFVFASQTETQGMVILESLAAGVPVVAVKDEVFDDIVRKENAGILTPKDHAAFSAAVLKVLRDKKLYASLAKNAKKSAEQHSLENTAEAFENVYTKMMQGREKQTKITLEKLFTDYFL